MPRICMICNIVMDEESTDRSLSSKCVSIKPVPDSTEKQCMLEYRKFLAVECRAIPRFCCVFVSARMGTIWLVTLTVNGFVLLTWLHGHSATFSPNRMWVQGYVALFFRPCTNLDFCFMFQQGVVSETSTCTGLAFVLLTSVFHGFAPTSWLIFSFSTAGEYLKLLCSVFFLVMFLHEFVATLTLYSG